MKRLTEKTKFDSVRIILAIVLMATIALLFCSSRANDMPPGCLPNPSGSISYGGCFGKALIDSIYIKAPPCLQAHENNCNGGVLEISNSCDAELKIGDSVFARGFYSVELYKDKQGTTKLKRSHGNYESYVPLETERLKIDGTLGSQYIVIGYRKTRRLCE